MNEDLDLILRRRLALQPAVQTDEAFVAAVSQRIRRHRRTLAAVHVLTATAALAALVLLAPALLQWTQAFSQVPALVQPTLHWAFTSVPVGLAAAAVVLWWVWRRVWD